LTLRRSERRGRRRFLAAVASLLVVLVVLAGLFLLLTRHGYMEEFRDRAVHQGPAAQLADLGGVDQLRGTFNKDEGTPRLVLMFSPT
jgi:hypothetical protein